MLVANGCMKRPYIHGFITYHTTFNERKMMIRRVIFNKKGGVGKTSISCNLAAISAAVGKKTLLIDIDPQANASTYLLSDEYPGIKEKGLTILDFFKSSLDGGNIFALNPFFYHSSRPTPDSFVHQTRFANLSIIASHEHLADIETQRVLSCAPLISWLPGILRWADRAVKGVLGSPSPVPPPSFDKHRPGRVAGSDVRY
jgi:hypothetical protein